ncbi:Adhesion G protein-coupled receptor F5 [Anabarilius grahami]|uniref:Adhesion G protein-coupled receptor F5 n=1 Tax=Anabarilius grahami TaxID=495550 RepID=A0A3N0YRX7_ANAGA|nr:Adhesion G protein-coupled receptor F5 [Anabarilius grahami]
MLKPSVESTSDPVAEEFVVNESVVAVETTVKEEQIPETTTDAPEVPSEALAETIPAPEPLPVPVAKEIIQDLAVTGGLTVDAINGCLGATEVAIEAQPLKLFKYTTDIKINASREAVIEQLRDMMREQKFPMCIKKGMRISSANITAASLKSFKYTIDIKINASREAVIEHLRASIRGQKFPMCIKKGMKISSANITTVCLSNSSQTKCKCENHYTWASEQCSKHGDCSPSQNGTCACIASIPTDGAFCRPPPASLKSFKYTIDIKINASREAVIEHLRASIRGQKFPMCIKKGMKISSANITVVDGVFCRPPPASLKPFKYTIDIKINASREAVIERLRALIRGQKFPMCVKKGMKISSANITAAPIKSFKYTIDIKINASREAVIEHLRALIRGQKFPMCVKKGMKISSANITTASLKSFKYTIDIKINASREAVTERLRALIRRQKFPMCIKKGMKISSANITTVCQSNSSQTECKCENHYTWASEQCSKHGVCSHSQNGTCGCITSLPTDGAFCRPPPGKEGSLYFKSKLTIGLIIKSDAVFDCSIIFAAPIKSFKYTIDIKINASREAVIERLRALIHGQKFPMCIKKGMKISSANITAASLKSFKYTIDIKIHASREAVIEHLRDLIRGQKFPMCVKKGMKISSANITAVCLSNSSQTECKCENHYTWASEQCSKHGDCGHSQNGTCGCITSLPTDGAFCRPPPASLKSFKYTIDIKINASREAVTERLRGLIRRQKFPMCVKKGMKISSANITAVDGVFCRPPPASLKSFKYTIDIKINASREAVIERLRALIRGQKFPMCVKKGMKISSANITAVCLSNSSQSKCKCENQYAWPSEQCSKHGVCSHSHNGTCGCITSLPTDGAFCRPPPAPIKSFKYTIDIKINASREAVIERLRALIRGQKFPMCIKKGMKISSANITTALLKSFKYTIDIKINASREAVIEHLRDLIRGQKFPMCVKKGMKISSANITAVCLSNSSQTECKCENHYTWASEQCSKHGDCGHGQNGTCGCITSLPTDGAFCRPPPGKEVSLYFKSNFKTGIIIKSDAVFDHLIIFIFDLFLKLR